MNANLPPRTLVTIKDWLQTAVDVLKGVDIDSARLDAEIILCHTLHKSRTYLRAYRDEPLSQRHIDIADARVQLRSEHVPIAYIIGHKEFYGRTFSVNQSVLIPRPESEALVSALLGLTRDSIAQTPQQLVDVGTGSGCLGISAKLELPELDVTLLDNNVHALHVASKNARKLGATVKTIKSDLLESYPLKVSYLLANLPYVDSSWERSPETDHEPVEALFAKDKGLALIKKLIRQSQTCLDSGGYLLLEADTRQLEAIAEYAQRYGLRVVKKEHFTITLRKH